MSERERAVVEKTLFGLMVLVLVTFGLLCCSQNVGLTIDSSRSVGELLTALLSIIVVSVTFSRLAGGREWRLVETLICAVAVFGPMAILLQSNVSNESSVIAFWLSLVIYLIFVFVNNTEPTKDSAAPWMLLVVTVFLVSTTYLFLGVHVFSFAQPAYSHWRHASTLLDIRYLSGTLFVLSWSIVAFVRSFEDRLPHLPDVPTLQVPAPGSDLPWLLRSLGMPVIAVSNVSLRILCFLMDIAWKTVATLCVRLLYFGIALAQTIYDSLLREGFFWRLLKLTLILPCALVALYAAMASADAVTRYLQAPSWTVATPELARLLILAFVSIVSCLGGLRLMVTANLRSIFAEELVVVTMIAMAVFVSSLALLLLARVKLLGVQNFDIPGPYSAGFGTVVSAGLILWLARKGFVVADRR